MIGENQKKKFHNKCRCIKVLVVDDEQVNIIALGLLLKSFNVSFAAAKNGKICLDLVKE